MATPDDWTDIGTGAASGHGTHSRCILELRARVEALEAQAAQDEQGQGPERGQEVKPLWKRMDRAFYDNGGQDHDDWVATINAVADWLANTGPAFCTAAALLRAEAQATREGHRG